MLTAPFATHVNGTNESSYQYGYKNGRNIAEAGKAYELGPEWSSVVNPEVTNVTACGDGYVTAYNHLCRRDGNSGHPLKICFRISKDGKLEPMTTIVLFMVGNQRVV